MKRMLLFGFTIICLLLPAGTSALSTDVLLAEVQPESVASASEEYIKIVNNGNIAVDMNNWYVQYFAAGAANFSTPTRSIKLAGNLPAHSSLTVASNGYKTTEASIFYTPTLAAPGGHIRLVSVAGATETQHDLLGWGSALHPEGSSARIVPKGLPYVRIKGTDGLYIDTDNNLLDFGQLATSISSVPGPLADSPTAYSAVEITELLPDPVSPKTDANDEFVELYNPGQSVINLKGYVIETGTSFSYKYTIGDVSLAAGSYIAFTSSQTKLALSNSSGRSRILDPAGAILDETVPYTKAVTGSSWALFEDTWQWTGLVTPGQQNQLESTSSEQARVVGVATSKAKSSKKTTSAAAKSAATPKVAKAATTTTKTTYQSPANDNKSLPLNPLVLAGVGIPLLGYMVYEYRNDISNKFAQYKRNRTSRRQARRQA